MSKLSDLVVFEPYQEDFLALQIELVAGLTKNWKGFNYPNLEQLKQTYSGENFTPETRHYAFENDKLVGFISTAVENVKEKRGSLQFPFANNGDLDLERVLIKKSITKLQEMGVEIVHCNIPDSWVGASEIIEKHGFTKGDLVNQYFLISCATYNFDNLKVPGIVSSLDPVVDKEELIRVFSSEMDQTPEQIGTIIDSWIDSENILANIVARNNNEIVCHTMSLKNNNNPDRATMTHVSVYNDAFKEYRSLMTKLVLQKIKMKGYKEVQFIGIPNEEFASYAEFNFPRHQVFSYQRTL